MSWVFVAITVGTTALSMKSAQNQADAQIEQSRLDQIASQNATEQAEQDQLQQEALDLSQLKRELIRTRGKVVAQQANTGIAGVTAERQKRNVDFQNTFDIENIKRQSENTLFSIRNQGFSNQQQLKNVENTARAGRPSDIGILTQSALSGLSTYAGAKSIKGKAKTSKGVT